MKMHIILATISMTAAAIAQQYTYITDEKGGLTSVERCGGGQYNVIQTPGIGESRSEMAPVIITPVERDICPIERPIVEGACLPELPSIWK